MFVLLMDETLSETILHISNGATNYEVSDKVYWLLEFEAGDGFVWRQARRVAAPCRGRAG